MAAFPISCSPGPRTEGAPFSPPAAQRRVVVERVELTSQRSDICDIGPVEHIDDVPVASSSPKREMPVAPILPAINATSACAQRRQLGRYFFNDGEAQDSQFGDRVVPFGHEIFEALRVVGSLYNGHGKRERFPPRSTVTSAFFPTSYEYMLRANWRAF